MIQSYFINGPPSRTHTPLSGWDYVTRGEHASVLRMIFNPIRCLLLFFSFFSPLLHQQRLSAVPFAPGPEENCRHFCTSCPQLLAHFLTPPSARPWHSNSSALRRPPSSNIKRQRSIIGLNVWWKYCVSLFVSFVCLSPTPPPPPSSSPSHPPHPFLPQCCI